MQSRHVDIVIARPAVESTSTTADPANLPHWAAGLAEGEATPDGSAVVVDSPMGRVRVTFAPRNPFGVLDHDVVLPSGRVGLQPAAGAEPSRRSGGAVHRASAGPERRRVRARHRMRSPRSWAGCGNCSRIADLPRLSLLRDRSAPRPLTAAHHASTARQRRRRDTGQPIAQGQFSYLVEAVPARAWSRPSARRQGADADLLRRRTGTRLRHGQGRSRDRTL